VPIITAITLQVVLSSKRCSYAATSSIQVIAELCDMDYVTIFGPFQSNL
jgi:hypothetical protein